MSDVEQAVADAHRREWAFVLAATVRVTRDLDMAEEAVQDAYVQALRTWRRTGSSRKGSPTPSNMPMPARRRSMCTTTRTGCGSRFVTTAVAPRACERCGKPVKGRGRYCGSCSLILLQEGAAGTP